MSQDLTESIWNYNGGIYVGMNDRGPLRYVGERHIITFGPTGSGKSRRLLLPNLASLLNWSMVVVDPKGELYAMTAAHRKAGGSEIVLLNPFDVMQMGSHGFDPVGLLDPSSDEFPDDAMGQAEAVVRVDESGRDKFFAKSAKDLVCACIMYSRIVANVPYTWGYSEEKEKLVPEPWPADEQERGTYGHLRVVLGKLSGKTAAMAFIIEKVAQIAACPELATKIQRYKAATPDSRSVNDIISTALSETEWLDSRRIKKDMRAGKFDFRSMRERPTTVYLVLPARRAVSHSTWIRMMLTAAMDSLLEDVRPPKVPTLFMIDEMAQLGNMPKIDNNITMLRGYGVKIWCVFQNLSQLKTYYGENWETFCSSSGIMQTFATNDESTAKYFSDRAGQKTGNNWTYSQAIGKYGEPKEPNMNFSQGGFPVVRPEEVSWMDEDDDTIIISNKVKGLIKAKAPYPDKFGDMRHILAADPTRSTDGIPPLPQEARKMDTPSAAPEKQKAAPVDDYGWGRPSENEWEATHGDWITQFVKQLRDKEP